MNYKASGSLENLIESSVDDNFINNDRVDNMGLESAGTGAGVGYFVGAGIGAVGGLGAGIYAGWEAGTYIMEEHIAGLAGKIIRVGTTVVGAGIMTSVGAWTGGLIGLGAGALGGAAIPD